MNQKIKKRIELYKACLDNDSFGLKDNYSISDFLALFSRNKADNLEIKADALLNFWTRALGEKRDGSLSFYTHIPYCVEKCLYCNLPSSKLEKEEYLKNYVNKIVKYYEFFSKTFSGEVFDNLYVGGGSPSILSEELLEKLLSGIFTNYKISDEGERTVENDPRTSTLGKLKILKKYGINRVSFGVQTFDSEVLKNNNRLNQKESEIKKIISKAQEVDFECINIDLLIGLYGDSATSFLDSLRKALALRPDSVSIYSLQPVNHYLDTTFQTDKESFFRWKRELTYEVFEKAADLIDEMDYFSPVLSKNLNDSEANMHINDASCFQIFKNDFRFNPKSTYVPHPPNENGSILGLGEKADSSIFGSLKYLMEDPLKEDPADYRFIGFKHDEDWEVVKSLVANLSNYGKVDRKKLKKRFGVDIFIEFKTVIEELKEIGAVAVSGDLLELKCKDQRKRFTYLLLFLDEKEINSYLQERSNLKIKKDDKLKKGNLEKKVKKEPKYNSLENQNYAENLTLFEGKVKKINRKKVVIEGQNSKKINEFNIAKKTKFFEAILEDEKFTILNRKKVDYRKIKKGDEVALFFHEDLEFLTKVEKISITSLN